MCVATYAEHFISYYVVEHASEYYIQIKALVRYSAFTPILKVTIPSLVNFYNNLWNPHNIGRIILYLRISYKFWKRQSKKSCTRIIYVHSSEKYTSPPSQFWSP